MEIVEEKEKKLVFSVEMSNSLANAIRRHVHEIPTIAVEEVEISKNDSALHDETIAHRIGLVPLKSKKDSGEIKIKANKEGIVYSSQIEGDATPVYGKMPLTLLKKGQEIEIKGTLRAGKGREHSKFVPGLFSYRNEKEITLPQNLKKEIQETFPNADISSKGQNIVVKDTKQNNLADFCEGLADKKGEKYTTKETGNVIVEIESFGQASPREIFENSLEQLKADLEQVSKELK